MEDKEKDNKPKDDDTSEEEKKKQIEAETAQLEALLKAIKAIEEDRKKRGEKPPRRKSVIAVEFGGAFHANPILNLMAYYTLNLTIIYAIIELFGFGVFKDLPTVLLFVLVYTLAETFFRAYILMNHFKFVLQTLGFIFYFGYLTLFFTIDVLLFPNGVRFVNETLLVVFVGMFIVIRYVLTQFIKSLMMIKLR